MTFGPDTRPLAERPLPRSSGTTPFPVREHFLDVERAGAPAPVWIVREITIKVN